MNCLAIVVDYCSHADTGALAAQLASLPEFATQRLRCILVDNGSTPALSAESLPAGIQVLRITQNLGYAGAIEAAIAFAKKDPGFVEFGAQSYWLLNPDLDLERDCLTQLLATLERYPQTAAVGPTVFKGHSTEVWGARGILDQRHGLTAMSTWTEEAALPQWSYIPGCSILVRATDYASVGGLPTHYRLYFEETELCVRLQKLGKELRVVPAARVYHRVDSMRGGVPGRAFTYFFVRNNLAFWRTNFQRPLWIQWLRLVHVALREVVIPLRRARNPNVFFSRLGLMAAGMWDSVSFASRGHATFEARLFPDMAPVGEKTR